MLRVTRWRDGKIETIDIDTSLLLEDGRAGVPAWVAEQKAARQKLLKEGGAYYQMMIERIKHVLADPGRHHPAYDPKQGYEIAGFVWFHGYNDIIASTTYPNGSKPRGYEQYSWLLAHLIRNVRKDLNAPKMPVVIGVFGQGGKLDKPHPFREAQAVVADFDEFKGTIAAVRTAQFLDARIGDIKGKYDRVMAYEGDDPDHPYARLQAKVRELREKMVADAGDRVKTERQRGALESRIRKACAEAVKTPEEIEYLKNNVSNQGFHYSGSPKFFVRAGEAFAKALANLTKDKK
jgi:alpha-galactosidase